MLNLPNLMGRKYTWINSISVSTPKITLVCFCSWFPVLCTDDGETHLSFLVYVWMVDLCQERDLGGLEGILSREVNLDPKCSFVVRGIILQRGERSKYDKVKYSVQIQCFSQ